MDLNYTEEELAFRDEVREFLDSELPKRISDKVKGQKRLTREDMVEWHSILNKRGWLAANWPKGIWRCGVDMPFSAISSKKTRAGPGGHASCLTGLACWPRC